MTTRTILLVAALVGTTNCAYAQATLPAAPPGRLLSFVELDGNGSSTNVTDDPGIVDIGSDIRISIDRNELLGHVQRHRGGALTTDLVSSPRRLALRARLRAISGFLPGGGRVFRRGRSEVGGGAYWVRPWVGARCLEDDVFAGTGIRLEERRNGCVPRGR